VLVAWAAMKPEHAHAANARSARHLSARVDGSAEAKNLASAASKRGSG
jgi:hypothetical protein